RPVVQAVFRGVVHRWDTTLMASTEYLLYIKSALWRSRAESMKKLYEYHCAVCGLDWKLRQKGRLDCHHVRYWDDNGNSLLGREAKPDLCPLCDRHHPRGKFTWQSIRARRTGYLLE